MSWFKFLKSSRQLWLLLKEPVKCKEWKITRNSRIFLKKKWKKTRIWKRKAVRRTLYFMFLRIPLPHSLLLYFVLMRVTLVVWWAVLVKQLAYPLTTNLRTQVRDKEFREQEALSITRGEWTEIWIFQELWETLHTKRINDFLQKSRL